MLKRRDILLGAGAMALTAGGARAQSASQVATPDDLSTIVRDAQTPAAGGIVVTASGVSWLEAAGVRRAGAGDAVTRDDWWHLGSNTKAMTAALYAKLVEQGRARWGLTVAELFPGVTLDAGYRGVTVEQLLGHRAGIQDRPIMMGGWLMRAHRDTRPLPEQRAELAAQVLGAAPASAIGGFAYSNVGYIIVGAAIERITGKPWEEAITEGLFRPAGMGTAGFGPPTGAQPWGHRAGQAMDPARLADNPAAMGPAGRAHMSLNDYGKFLRLFLTRGGDVLSADSITKLTTPVAGTGEGPDYALGWGVATNRPWARGPALLHEGSNTMWHAAAAVAPQRGTAIATVSNSEPGGATACRELQLALVSRFAAG